jgi:hypothetical protein
MKNNIEQNYCKRYSESKQRQPEGLGLHQNQMPNANPPVELATIATSSNSNQNQKNQK